MYTWGYIKDVSLAKLDLTETEATAQDLLSRFPFYANEVITQVCSTIKPKHTFVKFAVYRDRQSRWNELITYYNVYDTVIIDKPSKLSDVEKAFWTAWENSYFVLDLITMPSDFVSFNDDESTVVRRTESHDNVLLTCHDDDFVYQGYNQIQPLQEGLYTIAYNARWYTFAKDIRDDTVLNVPVDILECIPSYIAHQCYKIDDEVKAQILRNEYEIFFARIDDSHFKNSKSIKIGGNW